MSSPVLAAPLFRQARRAGNPRPFREIVADEGGKVLGATAGLVKTLHGKAGADVGHFEGLIGGLGQPLDDVAGVPAGARSPNQPKVSYPGRPASATVTRSGAALARFAPVEASATSLPSWMNCNTVDAGENITSSRPPRRSVAACAVPVYGTCTSLMPAITLKSSPLKWEVPPTPAEPNDSCPGLSRPS